MPKAANVVSSFQIAEAIATCGYDADHFTLAVSLPVSLTLRSHSLNIWLAEKLPDSYDEDFVVPIKQA